jgi:ketosteroid isomerase-like protein
MTPQENTNVVKQTYAAYKAGDLEGLLKNYAEEVRWEIYGPATIPTTGTRHGIAALREFFATLDKLMAVQSFEPREYIAQDDQVAVLGDYKWTVKPTGRTFASNWVHVVTLKEGKITRFREYTDTAAAVAAFGS